MVIDSINTDHIQKIKGMKVTDEMGRTSYKVRVYALQEIDLKTFRNKQDAQHYLDDMAEAIAKEDANHIVIVSEL